MTKLKIGNVLLAYVSRHIDVFSQDTEDPESLVSRLNNMTAIECRANIKSVVSAIKTLPEYEEYPKRIPDSILIALVNRSIKAVLLKSKLNAGIHVSNKYVGNNFYVIASNYIELSVEEKCCTLRRTLNIYGPALTNDVIAMMIPLIRNSKEYKSLGFELHTRFIYLLLRKAIRMTGVDMGKLRRYTTKHFPKRRQKNALKKR